MNKDNNTYTFDIPMLHQAEDIVRRNGGDSLPQAFALYAEEIVHHGRCPVIPEAEAAVDASDYAVRLVKVNETLDAVMRKGVVLVGDERVLRDAVQQPMPFRNTHLYEKIGVLTHRRISA